MIDNSEKRLQTTVFRLPTEIHKDLRQAALERGISMGEALRQAVGMWLSGFRLPTDIHKALRQAALEQGISMGEALRQAVEMWLKEHIKTRRGVKK